MSTIETLRTQKVIDIDGLLDELAAEATAGGLSELASKAVAGQRAKQRKALAAAIADQQAEVAARQRDAERQRVALSAARRENEEAAAAFARAHAIAQAAAMSGDLPAGEDLTSVVNRKIECLQAQSHAVAALRGAESGMEPVEKRARLARERLSQLQELAERVAHPEARVIAPVEPTSTGPAQMFTTKQLADAMPAINVRWMLDRLCDLGADLKRQPLMVQSVERGYAERLVDVLRGRGKRDKRARRWAGDLQRFLEVH